jgi:hypothetical protein
MDPFIEMPDIGFTAQPWGEAGKPQASLSNAIDL